MNFYNITSLNANSLVGTNRRQLFLNSLNDFNSNIIFISETCLKDKHTFNIPGYNVFRQDRSMGNGGGTLIMINEMIKFRNFHSFCSTIEYTKIEVFLNGQWICLVSIYIPPRSANFSYTEFENIFNTTLPIICGGDFNARMLAAGDYSNNSIGIQIHHFLENNDFLPLFPPSPTCYRSIEGSFIDFFITSNSLNLHQSLIEVIPTFSDHSAIKLHTVFTATHTSINNNITIYSYSYANISSMNLFLEYKLKNLNISTNHNHSNGVLESIANSINDIFIEAIEKFVPTHGIPIGKILLSSRSLSLKSQCKNLHRKLIRNRFSQNTNQLKKQLSLLRNMFLNSIKSDISNYYKNFISKTCWNSEVYKLIKQTTSYKKISGTTNTILTDTNGNRVMGGSFDANQAFAKNFLNNHELTINNTSTFTDEIHQSIHDFANTTSQIAFNSEITPQIISDDDLEDINLKLNHQHRGLLTCSDEVQRIIGKKINKRSSGPDNMPIILLKLFNMNIITLLALFFNHLLANSYFPNIWKVACITPIPKIGKDLKQISNWRPISQLTTLSKVFEKIIDIRLSGEVSDLNILPNHQFGFTNKKKHHSTSNNTNG